MVGVSLISNMVLGWRAPGELKVLWQYGIDAVEDERK